MANTPLPSATLTVSFECKRFFELSTRKYSTSPFTPASLSCAIILRKIVAPMGVDCKREDKRINVEHKCLFRYCWSSDKRNMIFAFFAFFLLFNQTQTTFFFWVNSERESCFAIFLRQ